MAYLFQKSRKNFEKDSPVWRTIDEFDSAYYSGIDACLYIGDRLVEEINSVAWVLQQAVQPIFSYASYTARGFMRGNRQVMGQFIVNFKEAAYIPTILASLSQPTDGSFVKGEYTDKTVELKTFAAGQLNTVGAGNSKTSDVSLWVKNNPTFLSAIADAFDQAVYQDSNNIHPNIDLVTQHDDAPLYGNIPLFDILIKFGEPTENIITYTPDPKNNITNAKRLTNEKLGTVRRIVDVEITGIQQAFDDSGKPITETYMFMARDIDNVGSFSGVSITER